MDWLQIAQQLTALDQHQLARVLDEVVGLYLEYRNQHGYDEQAARAAAVKEVLDGLAAQVEIAAFEASLPRIEPPLATDYGRVEADLRRRGHTGYYRSGGDWWAGDEVENGVVPGDAEYVAL